MERIMRQEYEMSQDDLDELLRASCPTRAIALNCGPPPSPQVLANRVWRKLAEKMGFEHMTVEPLHAKGDRFFTAIPKRLHNLSFPNGSVLLPKHAARIWCKKCASNKDMIDLLRAYRADHDADACSPNGSPEACGCSLCRKLDSILSRIGREDGGKIEGKGREDAIRSE